MCNPTGFACRGRSHVPRCNVFAVAISDPILRSEPVHNQGLTRSAVPYRSVIRSATRSVRVAPRGWPVPSLWEAAGSLGCSCAKAAAAAAAARSLRCAEALLAPALQRRSLLRSG